MATNSEAALTLVEAETSGLNVRSRDGDNLGHIKALMVDRRTGHSTYAVLSLGGFLGFNKSYYPVPFSVLEFDVTTGEYVVVIDRRVLEGGPSWASNAPEFNQSYADRVSSYYGTEPTRIV